METGPVQGWISLVRIDCEKWGSSIVINKNKGSVLGKGHNGKLKRGTASSLGFQNHETHTKVYKPTGGMVSPSCSRHRAPHSTQSSLSPLPITVPHPIPSRAAPHSCSQPCSCQPQAQAVAQSSESSWNCGQIEGVICHHVEGSTLRGQLLGVNHPLPKGSWTPEPF